MPDAVVLKAISSRLSESPFCVEVSAVKLDDCGWLETVDLLKSVVVHVFPSCKDKIAENSVFMEYILDQVHIMNETPLSSSLASEIGRKNKEAIFWILDWILSNFEPIKLRAYLSQFLLPIDIPGEFLDDDNIVFLKKAHADLQQDFQQLHAQLANLLKTAPPVDSLKAESALMDGEKQQLSEKIANLKARTSGEPSFAALLGVTSSLRIQQEEEAKLGEKLTEQKILSEHALQVMAAAGQRYEAKRKQLDKFQSKEFLNFFNAEVERMDMDQHQALFEQEDSSRSLAALQKYLGEPVSVAAVQDLGVAVERLEVEISKLKQLLASAIAGKNNETDSRLSVFRQQSTLAARKRESFERELQLEADFLANAEAELRSREEKFKSIKGVRFVAKSEFKEYAQSLRDKTVLFKKLQPELRFLNVEAAVLTRTEQIVRDQLRARGLKGEDISGVSQISPLWDVATPEALTADLKNLDVNLRNKKVELTPQLKALKQFRQELDSVLPEYTKNKAAFDDKIKPVMARMKQLRAEAASVDDAILEAVVRYRELALVEAISKREADWDASTIAGIAFLQAENEFEIARIKADVIRSKGREEISFKQKEDFGKLKKLVEVKLASMDIASQHGLRGHQVHNNLQL